MQLTPDELGALSDLESDELDATILGDICPDCGTFHEENECIEDTFATLATLSGEPGAYLECWDCGEKSSANPRDYFWMPPNEPFICSCGGGCREEVPA